jgi:DNA polymerase III epsilon subunit-like protein
MLRWWDGRAWTAHTAPITPPVASPPSRNHHPAPHIPTALLTRKTTHFPVSSAIYTAIDIETTGLDPAADRILEIGMIKFTADGLVLDEFATLVASPFIKADAAAVNHITERDLHGAPRIEDALIEAFAFMSGTVLASHNLEFEEGFLSETAARARIALPDVIGVCTLDACRRLLDGRSFSLTAMHKTATGEFAHDRHTALGDARAVKEVFHWLVRTALTPLHLSDRPRGASSRVFDVCQIKCRPVTVVSASMAELLAAYPQSPRHRAGDPDATTAYKRLLDESVRDGLLTMQETRELSAAATSTGLTGTQLRELHRQAWDATFADEKNTPLRDLARSKRREMFLLAEALGLDVLATEIRDVIVQLADPEPTPNARYLRGLRIAIIGEDAVIVAVRERAQEYGAKLAVNITKTVQWLATSTPDATDSRHDTARRLGIPIIDPNDASDRLSEAIRDAELTAFERQREIDEYEAARRRREAEADAYWRPAWRRSELAKSQVARGFEG